MNKRKLLVIVPLLTGITACAVGLAVFLGTKPKGHKHAYSTGWSSDSEKHYHACTGAGCNSKKDSEVHKYGEWETVTAATTEAGGTEKRECTVCKYAEYRDTDKLTTLPVHSHTWGEWTVADTDKPDETTEGKATRICTGAGACDAVLSDKEYTLPALNDTDYTKSADTATCSAAGTLTYTFNKDDVSVSFEVATPVKDSAHSYGEYIYTDGTGHYKVCDINSSHRTDVETHNTEGEDGACSKCGYKEKGITVSEFKLKYVTVDDALNVTSYGDYLSETLNQEAGSTLWLQVVDYEPDDTVDFFYDEVKVYLRAKGDGGTGELLLSDYKDGSEGHVLASFDPANRLISLDFRVTGEYDLIFRTQNVEKIIGLNLSFGYPADFKANVYSYDGESGEGVWNNGTGEYKIYENCPLMFYASVEHPAYQYSGYTVEVKNSDGTVVNDLLTQTVTEGRTVYVFSSGTVGKFTVKLIHEKGTAITFGVEVLQAPGLPGYLDGLFANEFKGVSVNFDSSNNLFELEVGDTVDAVYEYLLDGNQVETTFVSGTDTAFLLYFNDAYQLIYEQNGEKAVLGKIGAVENAIVGKWDMNRTMEEAAALKVNVSGKYILTSDVYINEGNDTERTRVAYSVDGIVHSVVTGPVTLDLKIGQTVKMWEATGKSRWFTVEIYIPVADVTLNENYKDLFIGESFTLTATVAPADATVKSVTWTSSNPAAATVDEYGNVTATGEGETTITVCSADGGKTAECTVMVGKRVYGEGEHLFSDMTFDTDGITFELDGKAGNTYTVEIFSISTGKKQTDIVFCVDGVKIDGYIQESNMSASPSTLTIKCENSDVLITAAQNDGSFEGFKIVITCLDEKIYKVGRYEIGTVSKVGIPIAIDEKFYNSYRLTAMKTNGVLISTAFFVEGEQSGSNCELVLTGNNCNSIILKTFEYVDSVEDVVLEIALVENNYGGIKGGSGTEADPYVIDADNLGIYGGKESAVYSVTVPKGKVMKVQTLEGAVTVDGNAVDGGGYLEGVHSIVISENTYLKIEFFNGAEQGDIVLNQEFETDETQKEFTFIGEAFKEYNVQVVQLNSCWGFDIEINGELVHADDNLSGDDSEYYGTVTTDGDGKITIEIQSWGGSYTITVTERNI